MRFVFFTSEECPRSLPLMRKDEWQSKGPQMERYGKLAQLQRESSSSEGPFEETDSPGSRNSVGDARRTLRPV